MSTKNQTLRRWEAALMAGLALSMVLGLWLDGQQARLAQKVIRLHVIAHSDSPADQDLKLAVRDAVLARASEVLPPGADRAAAEAALAAALPDLAAAGREVVASHGLSCPVDASLEDGVWFPTKTYAGFSLPAGAYTALRITIGDGAGRNWWCVVFPPLCLGSVSEASLDALGEFTDGEVALLTGETREYVIKFKAIELWEGFKLWAETL